jgi:hypothetical protein
MSSPAPRSPAHPPPSDSRDQSPHIPLRRNRSTRSIRAFLPVADETVLSTRGQALPLLISQLSHSNRPGDSRRNSFFAPVDDHSHHHRDVESGAQRNSAEYERGRPVHSRASSIQAGLSADQQSLWRERSHEDRGRIADAAMALLMTPQMRSMRLIGNTNPRYKWCAPGP